MAPISNIRKKNYSLPSDVSPDDMDVKSALKLIEDAANNKKTKKSAFSGDKKESS